jgi:hypothetical protein
MNKQNLAKKRLDRNLQLRLQTHDKGFLRLRSSKRILHALKVFDTKGIVILIYLFKSRDLLVGGRFHIYFVPVSQT